MIQSVIHVVAFLFVFAATHPVLAQPLNPSLNPSGIWLTEKSDAKVRVSRCRSGVCGIIVWLREPIDPATGKKQIDDKNENASLAKRPVIGINLFSGMKPSGVNRWSGRIYNADDGKSYDSNVTVVGPDSLKVEGCLGGLCGGETWTRSR